MREETWLNSEALTSLIAAQEKTTPSHMKIKISVTRITMKGQASIVNDKSIIDWTPAKRLASAAE